MLNDNGDRLNSVELSRMRKTYKAEAYKNANGHLIDAADDHTARVFANHYGNVAALSELHEQTIVEALSDAFEEAMCPLSLNKEQEDSLNRSPKTYALQHGLDISQMERVASGDTDTWLASCKDPSSSPYGTDEDNDCVSPIIGCLGCKNAVVGFSKLPAIFSLLEHILQRRTQLNIKIWEARYGATYRRIKRGIIPRFSDVEIKEAIRIAKGEQDLLWLPAEISLG